MERWIEIRGHTCVIQYVSHKRKSPETKVPNYGLTVSCQKERFYCHLLVEVFSCSWTVSLLPVVTLHAGHLYATSKHALFQNAVYNEGTVPVLLASSAL